MIIVHSSPFDLVDRFAERTSSRGARRTSRSRSRRTATNSMATTSSAFPSSKGKHRVRDDGDGGADGVVVEMKMLGDGLYSAYASQLPCLLLDLTDGVHLSSQHLHRTHHRRVEQPAVWSSDRYGVIRLGTSIRHLGGGFTCGRHWRRLPFRKAFELIFSGRNSGSRPPHVLRRRVRQTGSRDMTLRRPRPRPRQPPSFK